MRLAVVMAALAAMAAMAVELVCRGCRVAAGLCNEAPMDRHMREGWHRLDSAGQRFPAVAHSRFGGAKRGQVSPRWCGNCGRKRCSERAGTVLAMALRVLQVLVRRGVMVLTDSLAEPALAAGKDSAESMGRADSTVRPVRTGLAGWMGHSAVMDFVGIRVAMVCEALMDKQGMVGAMELTESAG